MPIVEVSLPMVGWGFEGWALCYGWVVGTVLVLGRMIE
jgi:hypothetical protein